MQTGAAAGTSYAIHAIQRYYYPGFARFVLPNEF